MNQRDKLWKAIIEDLMEDFLRFFFSDADHLFDFSRGFEYLDKELEQLFPPGKHNHKARYADKLIKIYTREQQEEWVLLHVETQGYPDKFFAKRMYQYHIRIWDRYDRRITAIVIFTDSGHGNHPSFFKSDYLGTSIRYDFNTYQVMKAPTEALQQSDNPFAQVVLTAQAYIKGKKLRGDTLHKFNLDLAKNLLTKKIPKEKVQVIMNFLASYIHFENPEMDHKFTEEIERITTKEKRAMGVLEYLKTRTEEVAEKAAKKADRKARTEERKAAKEKLAMERKAAEEKVARERRAAEEKVAKERKAAEERAKKARIEERKAADERAKKAVEEQRMAHIKKLIQSGHLNDDQIADIMDLPSAVVQRLRKTLS